VRRALLVAVLALACPAAASAGTAAVQILATNGSVVSAAASFPYSYPADGSLVRIGTGSTSAEGVTLGDVMVLGGRIRAESVFVPATGTSGARVTGLVVDGLAEDGETENSLIPLGAGDYVVVLQTARVGSGTGLVGLRVASAGSAIVVAPSAAAQAQPASAPATPRWSLLGFATLPTHHGPAVLEPFPTPLQPSAKGQRAVQLALQFLGVPYVWGGATPTGFDCSGLVMYVYGQLGIPLTHYTGTQFHEGAPIARDRLLPGDMVFFRPSARGPQHEGLYIGNGEFVHAPHSGDVVKISSLSDASYALSYAGAVRPG